MAYKYETHIESEQSPSRNAAAVTPSNTVDLANPAKALWVGVSGNVSVDTVGGQTAVVFIGVQGLLPVAVARVRATSTTATDIVALY